MSFWDCSLLEWSVAFAVIAFTGGTFWYVIVPTRKKTSQQ